MIIIDQGVCIKCGRCFDACILDAVQKAGRGKTATYTVDIDICADCGNCTVESVCPKPGAVVRQTALPEGTLNCRLCFLGCEIRPGRTGACKRWLNQDGVRLVRNRPLVTVSEVAGGYRTDDTNAVYPSAIRQPLVTAIGAGTGPDVVPFIVSDKVNGVDVVTAISEVPLHFVGARVKLDAEEYIGKSGAEILYRNQPVGQVQDPEYGCQFLHIGGPEYMHGNYGWMAAKVAAGLTNRERVRLRVQGGSVLELQAGQKPVIDGNAIENRIWGCGGASEAWVSGLRKTIYAPYFEGVADLIIILHRWIVGTAAPDRKERPPDRRVRAPASEFLGIQLKHTDSCGSIFPGKGVKNGWGGSYFTNPLDIIEKIDMSRLSPGFTIYFIDPAATRAAMFRLGDSGIFEPMDLTPKARQALERHRSACEPARVTCFLECGMGGGARSRLTDVDPRDVTNAVQEKEIALSVGGAPVDYIWPGGGANFMVNVEKLAPGIVSWNSSPCIIVPVEYTMTLDVFKKINGSLHLLKPLEEILKFRSELWRLRSRTEGHLGRR